MRAQKFTLNALLLIVIIFSAMTLFFTVRLRNMADRSAVNEFYRIEGTDYAIRYSSLEPDGIYQGSENANTLKLKGTFGFDWGAAREGTQLYLNEYVSTDLGVMHSALVRVDLDSFRKETLYPDSILRGRCASGELVCIRNVLLPSNEPKTNPFCTLCSLTSPGLRPESDDAEVLFLDPETGEILYSVRDGDVFSDTFDARYLERTLKEVRG